MTGMPIFVQNLNVDASISSAASFHAGWIAWNAGTSIRLPRGSWKYTNISISPCMEYSLNTVASSIPMAFSASTKIPVLPKITTKEKYNGRPAKFDTIFSRDRMRPWPFCPSSFIEYAIRKDRISPMIVERNDRYRLFSVATL